MTSPRPHDVTARTLPPRPAITWCAVVALLFAMVASGFGHDLATLVGLITFAVLAPIAWMTELARLGQDGGDQ